MATNYSITGLSINPQEAKTLYEAIVERAIIKVLEPYHTFFEGIVYDTQIPIVGNMGLVGKTISGCGTTDTASFAISAKKWVPKLVGFALSHCALEIDAQFKLFRNYKRANPDMFNPEGSEEAGVIYMQAEKAVNAMLNRLVWFGDTAAKTIANGGNLTNLTDITYFTPIDGLFKQIFTEITTTSKNYVAITENAGASISAQTTLQDNFAFTLFKKMWLAADARLKSAKNELPIQIHVSQRIADNWLLYKADKSLAFTTEKVDNGGLYDIFMGMEIVARPDWDANIEAYQSKVTTYNLPNRAIMTTPGNIPIGITNGDDLTTLDSWYSRDTETWRTKFATKLDVKHLENYMTVAAY